MMTSSNGNIFRVIEPLCGEFTGHRWIPLTKASDAELWWFLWSKDWVNNREAGDLRRHRVHYDVILMSFLLSYWHRQNCTNRSPGEANAKCLWHSWRLKSSAKLHYLFQHLVASSKYNKAGRVGVGWGWGGWVGVDGGSTGDRWIPLTKGQ